MCLINFCITDDILVLVILILNHSEDINGLQVGAARETTLIVIRTIIIRIDCELFQCGTACIFLKSTDRLLHSGGNGQFLDLAAAVEESLTEAPRIHHLVFEGDSLQLGTVGKDALSSQIQDARRNHSIHNAGICKHIAGNCGSRVFGVASVRVSDAHAVGQNQFRHGNTALEEVGTDHIGIINIRYILKDEAVQAGAVGKGIVAQILGSIENHHIIQVGAAIKGMVADGADASVEGDAFQAGVGERIIRDHRNAGRDIKAFQLGTCKGTGTDHMDRLGQLEGLSGQGCGIVHNSIHGLVVQHAVHQHKVRVIGIQRQAFHAGAAREGVGGDAGNGGGDESPLQGCTVAEGHGAQIFQTEGQVGNLQTVAVEEGFVAQIHQIGGQAGIHNVIAVVECTVADAPDCGG